MKRATIQNGAAVPLSDGEQLLLDIDELRERFRLLTTAIIEEDAAKRTVRDLQTQLGRAKQAAKRAHEKVLLLSSDARRRQERGLK